MAHTTPLELQTATYLAEVRKELVTTRDRDAMLALACLCAQVRRATRGDNLWCTGVRFRHDPRYSDHGLEECLVEWSSGGKAADFRIRIETIH